MPVIEDLIRPGCVVAFDTNALWSHRRLFEVCDLANELRWDPPLQLVVPAVAHGEHVLHIRHQTQAKGRIFDSSVLREGLERKGLRVAAFGSEDAESVAELIAGQFADDAAWQLAKRNLAGRRLGLSREQLDAVEGKKLAATVDWLIAGQTATTQWILVTNDRDIEFEGLNRKITLEDLEAALGRLLGEEGQQAGDLKHPRDWK